MRYLNQIKSCTLNPSISRENDDFTTNRSQTTTNSIWFERSGVGELKTTRRQGEEGDSRREGNIYKRATHIPPKVKLTDILEGKDLAEESRRVIEGIET
jgi:hypothetical protein